MAHYNVPTLQSNLRGLQKLQQTTHREASPTTPTSKEQTDGSKSPLSRSPLFRRKSSPSVDTSPSAKPPETRASANRSPDPAGMERRKYQDMPVSGEGGANGSGQIRQTAYSKGSKEYKEQKKNPDAGMGMSPGGIGMSTGMSPSHIGTGMSPGGMGMSPDSAPEMSLITVMDLEMSLSQKRYYYSDKPALDISESIQLLDQEEQITRDSAHESYAHPFGISTGTSDATDNPRPKTPPPKPFRKRNNIVTDESPPLPPPPDTKAVSPSKTNKSKFSFSRPSRKTSEPSAPHVSPKLTRSSTVSDDIGSGLPPSRSEAQLSNKSKGAMGNLLDKLKRSPLSRRKFSSDDFAPVEPVKPDKRDFDQISVSAVSEAGVLKTNYPPLHTVAARNIGDLLKDPNIDPNAREDDNNGTALHWYVSKPRQSRHTLLYRCLQSGRDFDLNARDKYDNTPLHIAAEKDDIQYIRVLVAFGALLFCKNHQGKFPYQLAPPNSPSYEFLTEFKEPLLNEPFTLANLPSEDCTASLNIDELRNQTIGELMKPQSMSMLARMIDDDMVRAEREFHDAPVGPGEDMLSFNSARTLEERSADAARTQQRYYLNGWKKTAGSRVLFLDGGGIRGLVQIEVLMELEERTGCKVTELFDWIVGNSTGGIVALGLVYAGKTLSQMRQLYMQMKSKVFEGAGNFASAFMGMKNNTEKMEKILKTEIGEKLLSSVQQPRVMIATVNTECIPIKVQFFTNFMPEPAELYDVPVWKAARATSAAPIFFEPFEGKYVDGGVKANNPCMEALKVIKEYDRSRNHPERHFLLTVSIGTGIYPKQNMLSIDIRKNFWAKWQHLKQLVDMFVDAISDSESAAKGFEEWCKGMRVPIPFYRFSPQLDEAISPGETSDEKLVDLIIKTKLYLTQKEVSDTLDKLVATFKNLSKQSMVGQSLQLPRRR